MTFPKEHHPIVLTTKMVNKLVIAVAVWNAINLVATFACFVLLSWIIIHAH